MPGTPYKFFPGRGWITELMNKLPSNVRDKIRSWALFRPDDINDLYPSPRNRIEYPGTNIKGFRYPAPASQPDPKLPTMDSDDRLYDIKYYTRDTRRMPKELPMYTAEGRLPLPPTPYATKPMGSPGNKNPAVLAYDPTGLRSAMSATNAELDKALEKELPDHLPTYAWMNEEDMNYRLERSKQLGLALPPGRRMRWKVPPEARQARW